MKNEYRPRVRFMKFKDEWKLLSMKNFINNMYGGASITPSDYQNDGVPTVPKSAINSSGIADLSNSKFVSDDYCQKNLNSCVYSGDFVTSLRDLVPTAPNMGRVVKLIGESKRYLMPQGVYRLLLEKNIDENFLIAFSNSDKFRNSILKIKTGSTQVHIRNSQYLGIEIIAPSHEEQMKIGNFFKSLDDTISLHQQELEALKQTKQGFLQKMFPRETETVPQIRFKGFLGEWKSNTFSTIVERVSKQSSSDSLPKLEFEDIISGEGRLNKDISEKFDNRKGIVFEPGYILFGKLRPYLKNWLLPKFIGIALGDFWVFTTKHSPEFVYSLIQTNKFQTVANLSTGTKMPRSDWKTVSTTEFLIPSIEEQVKIGEFFRQLDEVIELKEKEIEALKETKKGFLQKMFV